MTADFADSTIGGVPIMVHLVGAGPGDPGLITVRGAALLAAADVVIADRLTAGPLLDHLKPGATVLVRGARRADLDQSTINHLLVEHARAGRRVVRLKGGDPLLFGRGADEAEALREAGIPFEVVPGMSAAMAAPACAGIALTQRGVAAGVAFVTAHESPEKSGGHLDWRSLADPALTVVLYMSVRRLDEALRRLVEAGRAPTTPAAVVEQGTLPMQRVVVGTLGDLAARAVAAGISPPALTLIGEVVSSRREDSWCGRSQAASQPRILLLADEDEGPVPTPREVGVRWVAPLVPRLVPEALREPLAALARYSWLALASRRSVAALAEALERAGLDARALAGLRVASVGGGTTGALQRRLSIRPDLVTEQGGTQLAQAILDAAPPGRILFPRAKAGREEFPRLLAAAGWVVDAVDAYAMEPDLPALREIIAEHRRWPFAAIGFASPRGAEVFLDEVAAAGLGLDGVIVGAIGRTTASALSARGLSPTAIPASPSFAGLLSALVAALPSPRGME